MSGGTPWVTLQSLIWSDGSWRQRGLTSGPEAVGGQSLELGGNSGGGLAAMTEYLRQTFFVTALEAGSPRLRCQQGGCLVRPPSHSVLTGPLLSVHISCIFPSSYEDTSHSGSGPHP